MIFINLMKTKYTLSGNVSDILYFVSHAYLLVVVLYLILHRGHVGTNDLFRMCVSGCVSQGVGLSLSRKCVQGSVSEGLGMRQSRMYNVL